MLRIFVDENDGYHGKNLYDAVVLKTHELIITGATVLEGIVGYGATNQFHALKVLRLSEDMLVIIEIVDVPCCYNQ